MTSSVVVVACKPAPKLLVAATATAAFVAMIEQCCTQADHSPLVAWCRNKSIDEINASVSRAGLRALECVTAVDDLDGARLLIEHGARINTVFPSGSTPLTLAATLGSDDMLALFLAAPDTDPNLQDLDRSSFVGQLTCVVSCGGKTALHIAAEKGAVATVIRLLVHPRIDAARRDNNDRTPLDYVEQALVLTPVVAATERKRDDLAQIRVLLCTALGLPLDVSLPDAATVNEMRLADERSVRLRAKTARNAEQERQRLDGLQRIAQLYTPRHSDVPTGDCLQFVAGFDGSATTLNDAYPGLLTASVLTATCCRRILEEVEHYEAHALSNTLLPLHTRHDDNLGSLERYGFLPLLTALVDATVSKNLELIVPGSAQKRAVARHAFVTRNWVGRTAEFAKFKTHRDKSAITINLCLEKTADVRGSQVLFFHPPLAGQEQPGDDRIALTLEHQVGQVAIHSGTHWHRTVPIEAGERASLIVWADLT
jgi:hypothetical protein